MAQTITDEQRQTLMKTTMTEGMNAWAYVQSKPKEDQPWVTAGILLCMKEGYGLTVLEVNWAIRDLRRKESQKGSGYTSTSGQLEAIADNSRSTALQTSKLP